MREHSFIFLNKNLPNSAKALRMCTLKIEKKKRGFGKEIAEAEV
jgi:hypothetical protein